MHALNPTHDPAARSWLASADSPGHDFPLQNLPFSVFRRRGGDSPFSGGIALGDQVIDLAAVVARGALSGLALEAARAACAPSLNDFFAMGPAAWSALRRAIFDGFHVHAPEALASSFATCLVPQSEVEHDLPARIGDYTDFYTSLDHALNVMRAMNLDADVSPNFRWMPIAYHGRASTIGVSGQRLHRPVGQALLPGASRPTRQPSTRLDYELELGVWMGVGNRVGETIALADAEQHVFGMCLLNDWSARDIQFWEMAPLGPFLSKNFATTISPWIVTLEALAPFRQAWHRPDDHPQPLDYLDGESNRRHGAIDIRVEAWLEAGEVRHRLSSSSFRHQYWTIAQMVAHHAMGGCRLVAGDLLGTGTISGPGPGEAGALIELTRAGAEPVRLANGRSRSFVEDGDSICLRAWCEAPGAARIGFGESRGTVLPARG